MIHKAYKIAVYRVYCDGKEFGFDMSREDAIATAWKFRHSFPNHKYYARRIA